MALYLNAIGKKKATGSMARLFNSVLSETKKTKIGEKQNVKMTIAYELLNRRQKVAW